MGGWLFFTLDSKKRAFLITGSSSFCVGGINTQGVSKIEIRGVVVPLGRGWVIVPASAVRTGVLFGYPFRGTAEKHTVLLFLNRPSRVKFGVKFRFSGFLVCNFTLWCVKRENFGVLRGWYAIIYYTSGGRGLLHGGVGDGRQEEARFGFCRNGQG